jgi:uncharacterized repeat protein (TIGR03803 family)
MSAGCGGTQPLINAPGVIPQTSRGASSLTGVHRVTTSSYRVVYTFPYTQHGGRPTGPLLDVNGMLYGTTEYGGSGGCSFFENGSGCGTVYRLDPKTGRKKVLYSFRGGSDGAQPFGGLIDVNGTLYGTTAYDGSVCSYGCGGTVYSITTSGKEKVLHSFGSYDGSNPFSGLINVNGTLYGTTSNGGCAFCGVVYSITTSGSFEVLHYFGMGSGSDGAYPLAGLIDVKGILYGTTVGGTGLSRFGTVYSITTAGTEKVLHSFGGSPDGARPTAGLIDVSGTLYGTTSAGGSASCYEIGQFACGTVYSITTGGKEKVLYSFGPGQGQDAWYPYAGLVNVKGTMYGTTTLGGCCSKDCDADYGCGTIYSISTTGDERVLHDFNGGRSDGATPDATSTMIDVDGTLYGTTPHGGGSKCVIYEAALGCGTVFALTP